jgi:glycosyltransferase involved in cell wall biosynthesis
MTATMPRPSAPAAPPAEVSESASLRADAVGMKGQSIVCFAKDWDEDPTSNNHIMRLLAKDNRVLWINSISTRSPNLTDTRDLSKMGRKLLSFFRGPKHVADGLWVYTPVVLPFPHSALATWINVWILRIGVALIRRRLGIKDFQLWVFLPTAAGYVGKLGESMVVYYVTDEWSKFGYVDMKGVAADDRELCKKADLVFTTARLLQDRRRDLNPEVQLALHGVDHAHFAAALTDGVAVPSDVANLRGPLLGFFGLIHEWIDLALVEYLASRHPEWTIVMIGKVSVDVAHLAKYPNVVFLGRKAYEELPWYCKAFSAGLIPFAINELTLNVNPIKLREYLSAGLPVVSTALPEVKGYPGDCFVAGDYEQFARGVEQALADDSPGARRRRSDMMRSETWEHKVAELGEQAMRVSRQKRAKSSV